MFWRPGSPLSQGLNDRRPLSRGLDLALGSDMSLEWNFSAFFLDVIRETSSGRIAKFWLFSQIGWPAVDTYLISLKKICSGNVE